MTQTNPNNRRIFTSVPPDVHRKLGKLSIDAQVTRNVVYEMALTFASTSSVFRKLLDEYSLYDHETGDGQPFIDAIGKGEYDETTK